jgi:aerobic-type carbon monoxide dehydrogenase small subunit (CoxS/CutS family)
MPIIDLVVNGKRQRLDADPQRSLLSVLRDTWTHRLEIRLRRGQCGACTVLLEDNPRARASSRWAPSAASPSPRSKV